MRKIFLKVMCITMLSLVMSITMLSSVSAKEASIEYQGLWTDYAAKEYAAGDGTKESPYLIKDASQLALLAKNVNEKKEKDKYYELISDIDLSGHFWNPIGNNDEASIGVFVDIINVFTGHFDGNSYTVRNMNIQSIDHGSFYGLFGYCNNGEIENINLENVTISLDTANELYVGSIVGSNSGKMSNCYISQATLDLKSKESISAGGITGDVNYGEVHNCYVEADIHCHGEKALFVGGATGDIANETNVSNCMSNCKVTTESVGSVDDELGGQGYSYCDYVGGFSGTAGRANGNVRIRNCYAKGEVRTYSKSNKADGGMFAGCCGYVDGNVAYENLVTSVVVYNNEKEEHYFSSAGVYPDYSNKNMFTIFNQKLKAHSDIDDKITEDEYDLSTMKVNDILKKYNFSSEDWCMDSDETGLHLYKEQVINSGTQNAKKKYICVTCGETYTNDFTEKHIHNIVIDQGKEATCTEDGLTEGKHCSVCNEVIKKQEVIPATGHKVVVDQAKEATCTENGLTEGSHCSVCNEVIKKQEVIPSTGHKEFLDSAKEATCTNTGLTEGIHCSICNKIIKKQEIIPALGHDFKDGVCTRCHNQLKGQWKQSGNKWWYQYEDGTYPKNEFIAIDNKLYRFDQYGYMQTGWFKVNNEDYYAASSGVITAQLVG